MMKKSIILILIVLSVILADELSFNYKFGEPEFVNKDGHMLLEVENCMLQGVDGEPLLPYHAFSILLPPGETLESADLSILAKKNYPLMLPIMPRQADRPLSLGKSGNFLKKESVYSKNEYTVSKIRAQVQYFGGAAVVTGAFVPMEYFPAEGRVDLSTRLNVTFKTKSEQRDIFLNKGMIKQLEAMIDNPEMLSQYMVSSVDESESMLIISALEYETAFDTLVDHYAKYGIHVEFMSTNHISSQYFGGDLQEKIRNAIKHKHQQEGLDYVLLGGNTFIVPARGLSCQVYSGGWIGSNNIPADLYYVALDGNWDSNVNGVFGEYDDSTGYDEADLIPELAIGRFPASNLTELKNMIKKSIRYQVAPIVDEMDKHVFFGEHLWDDPESWAADYMELLIGTRNDNGYTTKGLPGNLTIKKWYDQDSLGYWNEATVKNELADGYSFLHHDGHANTSYMMKFSLHEVNDSDFVTVNGVDHTTPVFYSHGCNCGGFDYSDCIASKIVTSPYISVGGVFNSRYGWFNEGQTEGPSIHLHREFENAIYGLHYTQFGRALSLARAATAPWVTALGQHEQNALRWNFYTINVLGDPAMRIYSQKPVMPQVNYDLSKLHLGKVKANVRKNSSAMENAGLAVLDMNGGLIGFAKSNAAGDVTVDLPLVPLDGDSFYCYVSGENLLLADTIIVSRESSLDIVDSHILMNVYPNPFNPTLTIEYSIPEEMDVKVKLFDLKGRMVDLLAEGQHLPGVHRLNYHAQDLASGLYLCRIEAEDMNRTFSKKILLLK